MRFDELFGNLCPIVGAVALAPLPGAEAYGRDLTTVIRRALTDCQALADAGCDALLIENRGDEPFDHDLARPETIAGMTIVVKAVADAFRCPLGITLLRNDGPGAAAIAAVTDARFIRVPLHAGKRVTQAGLMEGRPSETMRLRRSLDADVVILADLHMPYGLDAEDLRRDCEAIYYQGLADALVLPGADAVEAAKAAVPEAVMLCAGVRAGQANGLLDKVRGVILDSGLREDDDPLGPVDVRRATALVNRLRAG